MALSWQLRLLEDSGDTKEHPATKRCSKCTPVLFHVPVTTFNAFLYQPCPDVPGTVRAGE